MKWVGIPLMAATCLWLIPPSGYGQEKKLKDEATSKLLVGKWVQEQQSGKAVPASTKVVMVVKKDNTFAMEGKENIDGKEKLAEYKVTGKWKVAGGKLEMTVKTVSASAPGIPIKEGAVFTQTVIEINDTTLKTGNAKDKGKVGESVWKRAKD